MKHYRIVISRFGVVSRLYPHQLKPGMGWIMDTVMYDLTPAGFNY